MANPLLATATTNSDLQQPRHYWAFTGRILFDDEDTAFATPEPCTYIDALGSFTEWMIQADDRDEDTLRRIADLAPDHPLDCAVLVTSTFCSATPIYHGP